MAAHQTSTAGGAAMQGGAEYQNRVATWLAIRILAEQHATPPWGLPSHVTIESIACETIDPVDDIRMTTSADGYIYVQAKKGLSIGKAPDSPFGKTMHQFVKQYAKHIGKTNAAETAQPGIRPLEPTRDRLVIATNSEASDQVRSILSSVLKKIAEFQAYSSSANLILSQKQTKVLATVKTHLVREWKAIIGDELSEANFLNLLKLIHIQVLDVDPEERDYLEGRARLRQAILLDPIKDDVAWARLQVVLTNLASLRSGVMRISLRRIMIDSGLELKGTPSYGPDIDLLKANTEQSLRSLRDKSEIAVGSKILKIMRPSSIVLRKGVENGHLVVVGEAGVGKSGALHDLVERLREEGRTVVLLLVDDLGARSIGELRDELGLNHDILDVLKNWDGTNKSFLVIDALDAARMQDRSQFFYNLAAAVARDIPGWSLIVSVRTYDLHRSANLKRIFAGCPLNEYQDPELADTRHISIPKVDNVELESIYRELPDAKIVLNTEPSPIRELIGNLFNLRLFVELLSEGITEELKAVRTQIGLLNKYWDMRVTAGRSDSMQREQVLADIVAEMVCERRTSVDPLKIATCANMAKALEGLLSDGILDSMGRRDGSHPSTRVGFFHHVFYDYAVERLYLRRADGEALGAIARDPDLAITIRPSLVMYFKNFWNSAPEDRAAFWAAAFAFIANPNIPSSAKTIPPCIAAEEGARISEFFALISGFASTENDKREPAERFLFHLVGALHLAGIKDVVIGNTAGPWCELMEQCSHFLSGRLPNFLRIFISIVCEHSESMTMKQLTSVGLISRRLLDYFWSQKQRNESDINFCIEAVVKTIASDPQETEQLIRKAIESKHLEQYGYTEMFRLCHSVESIIAVSPKLAQSVYEAIFAHDEKSEESTCLGSSAILPLRSTRRQDFQSNYYALKEAYANFLSSSVPYAVGALINILFHYINRRHSYWGRKQEIHNFQFQGQDTKVTTDGSDSWDRGDVYQRDEPIEMLNDFETYLKSISGDISDAPARKALLLAVCNNKSPAVLWRRILRVAASFPDTLGMEIKELIWVAPMLLMTETAYELGHFISCMFPRLVTEDQIVCERAILRLTENAAPEMVERVLYTRNRLLGCIPPEIVRTEEAEVVLSELATKGGPPDNTSGRGCGGGFTQESILEGNLHRYGINSDSPECQALNKALDNLKNTLSQIENIAANSDVNRTCIEEIVDAIACLNLALSEEGLPGVPPELVGRAECILGNACVKVGSYADLLCSLKSGKVIKEILLRFSNNTVPMPAMDNIKPFDGGYESAPRIEAAAGLMKLAAHADWYDLEVLTAIKKLSIDAVPSVRFQVICHVNALYYTDNELMWEIIESAAAHEPEPISLLWLVQGPMIPIAPSSAERTINLLEVLRKRIGPDSSDDSYNGIHSWIAHIYFMLFVCLGNERCRLFLDSIAATPIEASKEVLRIVSDMREIIEIGLTEEETASIDKSNARVRAMTVFVACLGAVRDDWQKFYPTILGKSHEDLLTPQEKHKLKIYAEIFDHAATALYHGSGSYARQHEKEKPQLSYATRKRVFCCISPILDIMGEVEIPAVAHHMIETLESFIDIDPSGVLRRLGRLIDATKKMGYQHESLAASVVVRMVECYLSEYRQLMQEDKECRTVIRIILDVFVEANWPEARRLVYKLDEIYR